MKKKSYLAIDVGASSGRAVCGMLKGSSFEIHEIFRFSNDPVHINGSLRWNILSLWTSILRSISECFRAGFENIGCIGIDTWGVDFVLLDKNGQVIWNPYHYRDNLTEGVEEKIRKKIKDEDLYRITGLLIGRVTSFSQMVALREKSSWVFEVAKTFLMMPDFFRYCLCNATGCEITAAGSSQLLDINTKKWSKPLFDLFSLPYEIMPWIDKPGRIAGKLNREVSEQLHCRDINVAITAGHDTASAAVSVPFVDEDTLFMSLGTWAVFGFISESPCVTSSIFEAGFINEAGFDCVMIVRNMSGLYLFENLYRQLLKKDRKTTYRDMIDSASSAKPFQVFINPNDSTFFSVSDVISAIRDYCDRTGQKIAEGLSEIFRTILEGIALSFRQALKGLEMCTGRSFRKICIVGGGVRNTLLCQMVADATGLEIITGPAEATSIGNLCIQAFAEGEISNTSEIRTISANSCDVRVYRPEMVEEWKKQYNRFCHLYKK